MSRDPTMNFEIPQEMRAFAEKSVEQARKAFDGYIAAAQRAVSMFDSTSAETRGGVKEVGEKAMSFAERNIAASFELAQKLVRTRDVEEMLRLQAEYVQAQMKVLAEQAKELNELSTRMAREAGKPR
jgi:phasin